MEAKLPIPVPSPEPLYLPLRSDFFQKPSGAPGGTKYWTVDYSTLGYEPNQAEAIALFWQAFATKGYDEIIDSLLDQIPNGCRSTEVYVSTTLDWVCARGNWTSRFIRAMYFSSIDPPTDIDKLVGFPFWQGIPDQKGAELGLLTLDQLVSQLAGPIIDLIPTPPPPVVGQPPRWAAITLPKFQPGAAYRVVIARSSVLLAPNQTLQDIVGVGLPSWLRFGPETGSQDFVLWGTAPSGITQETVTLKAIQSDSLTATTTLPLLVDNRAVYAYVQYARSNNNMLTIRVGENDTQSFPEVTVQGPDGWGGSGTQTATRFNTDPLLGKPYFFVNDRPGAIPGDYTITVNFLGQVRYATLTISADSDTERELTLSDIPPGNAAGYLIVGDNALPEGNSAVYKVTKDGSVIADATLSVSGNRAGVGLSGNSLYAQINQTTGDGYTVTLSAVVGGVTVATKPVQIQDTTSVKPVDYIRSILHKYIPKGNGQGDEYYLIQMDQYASNNAMQPCYRCMADGDATWRTNWSVMTPGSSAENLGHAEYNQGYHYAVGPDDLSPTEGGGTSIWQFKRSIDADDMEAIEIRFSYTNTPVFGEVVYDGGYTVTADPADFEGDGSTTPPPTTGDGFDTSYTYSRSGQDAKGTPFVDSAAPSIVAVDRTRPRLDGNDYVYPVQVAQNTALFQRHAPKTLRGWTFVYPGFDPVDSAERAAILSRGYGAIADSTPNRGQITRTRLILNINSGREEALLAANGLPDSDPRKAPLLRWANNDELSVDAAVCELLGRRIEIQKQNNDWTAGNALMGITLNFENHKAPAGSGISDEQARMDAIGLVMRGVRLQAIEMNQAPPKFICYDHGGLLDFNIDLASKDITTSSGTYTEDGSNTVYSNAPIGVPAYYLPGRLGLPVKGGSASAPMATTNQMVAYAKAYGGLLGSQEYDNTTYDDEPLYQEVNGVPIQRTVTNYDGKPVKLLTIRTDARRTVIMGEECDLLGPGFYSVSEADNFLLDWYRRAQYSVGDYDVRAGLQFLAASNVRQPGFELLDMVYWQRADTEGKKDNRWMKPDNSAIATNPATGQPYDIQALNRRPLNPDFVVFDSIWACVVGGVDMIRTWMEPQPVIDTPGKNIPGNNRARGVYELYNKVQNRLSEVDFLKQNITYPLLGELPIRNFSRDRAWHNYNDEPEKKMLMGGRFCPERADRNKTPWLVLCAAYPAQDVGMQTVVTIWRVNPDGTPRSGSLQIRVTGRRTYLEPFQCPADWADLTAAQLRYQYTDMTGDVRTRHMDWRVPIPTTNLTPPPPMA